MLNHRIFFAWALLLPGLVPYLAVFSGAGGAAFEFLFRYLWLAGVPYLMLVLALLIWMEDKDDYRIRVGVQRALLVFLPILAGLSFVTLEWFSADPALPVSEAAFGVGVFSACLLIVGYLYALVVEFIYFVAKESAS